MAYMNYSPKQYDSFSPEITYTWWCPRCKVNHYTPCCPYFSDAELMSVSGNAIPGICPVCGRPLWEHGMTMD